MLGLKLIHVSKRGYWHDDAMTYKRVTLLDLCEGNPPVTNGFPHRGPVI